MNKLAKLRRCVSRVSFGSNKFGLCTYLKMVNHDDKEAQKFPFDLWFVWMTMFSLMSPGPHDPTNGFLSFWSSSKCFPISVDKFGVSWGAMVGVKWCQRRCDHPIKPTLVMKGKEQLLRTAARDREDRPCQPIIKLTLMDEWSWRRKRQGLNWDDNQSGPYHLPANKEEWEPVVLY